MTVTLFLVALEDIVKQVQEPVEIVGYADDHIHQRPRYGNGTNKHSICAEQPVEVDKKKRFHDISGKTIAMHTCARKETTTTQTHKSD
jgi:hypothetical protein